MKKATQINKMLWLMKQLMDHPRGRSFEELNRAWMLNSRMNPEEKPLSKRTVRDYKNQLEEMFHITISCDLSAGYRYFVRDLDKISGDNLRCWMMEAFAVNRMIADSTALYDRIAVENIPSADEDMQLVVTAMKEGCKVEMNYQDFYDKEERHLLVSPFYLKVFRQRWYVIGKAEGDHRLRRFALDRARDLWLSDETFVFDGYPSVDEVFADSFGVMRDECGEEVERVRLKVTDRDHKRAYLRLLPLHRSQREPVTESDYSVFELSVLITYDFIHELLSHGAAIEVLSPQWVRDEMKWEVEEMAKAYK